MKVKLATLAVGMTVLMALEGCGRRSDDASKADRAEATALDTTTRQEESEAQRSLTLPAGKSLKVRLVPTLSTKTHRPGDTFTGTLAEPLEVDGQTVAPKGAPVEGKVVESDKGGRVRGRARIAVQLVRMELPGGKNIDIATNTIARTARATKAKDAQKIGIGAGIGAAVGAIAGGGMGAAIGAASGGGAGTGVVLATRGNPAVLRSETLLVFRLRYPIQVS